MRVWLQKHHEKYPWGLLYALMALAFCLPIGKAPISISYAIACVFFVLIKLSRKDPSMDPRSPIKTVEDKLGGDDRWIPWTPLNTPIFLFLGYLLLSFLWGIDLHSSAKGFFKYFRHFLLVFLVLEASKIPKAPQKILTALCLGLFVTSCNGIFQYFSGYDFIRGNGYAGRILANFPAPTTFSSYLSMTLPLVFMKLLGHIHISNMKSAGRIYRKDDGEEYMFEGHFGGRAGMVFQHPGMIFYMIALGLAVIAFFLAYSRNTFFFLLLSSVMSLFIFWRPKHWIKILTLVCLITALSMIKMPSTKSVFETLVNIKNSVSLQERFYLWGIGLKMVEDKPLLGHGLLSITHIQKNYYPKNSQNMPFSARYLYLAYPHNGYLSIWIEIGLIGLLLYLYIYLVLMSQLIRGSFQENSLYQKIFLISILTFILSSFFDTFLHSTQTRFTFWLVVGLAVASLKIEKHIESNF